MTSSSRSESSPPSPKRIKLEDVSDQDKEVALQVENEEETEEDQCSICLHSIVDRTVIPPCSHDMFCFECIVVWSEQSRRCPLCTQSLGDHLIHNIRSNWDYQKFFLPPLRSSVPPAPLAPISSTQVNDDVARRRRTIRERQWGRRVRESREEEDRLEKSLERRRRIYQLGLYAKHTASNPHTKYRPYPAPSQFASNPELIHRATAFLRRELRVWVNLDVEFLTTFTISIMKSLDIRTEGAVKLLSEFLDMDERGNVDPNRRIAQHFAHEVYSFMRSPYKDLFIYDNVAQYDSLPELEINQPHPSGSSSRIEKRERRRSHSRHRRRSRSRSGSYSPSGRYHERDDYEPPDAPYISTTGDYSHHSSSLRYRGKGKERERSRDRGHSPSTSRYRSRSLRRSDEGDDDHRTRGHTSARSKGKQPERYGSRSGSTSIRDGIHRPGIEGKSKGKDEEDDEARSRSEDSCRASSVTLSDCDLQPPPSARNESEGEGDADAARIVDQDQDTPRVQDRLGQESNRVKMDRGRAPRYRTLMQSVREHLGSGASAGIGVVRCKEIDVDMGVDVAEDADEGDSMPSAGSSTNESKSDDTVRPKLIERLKSTDGTPASVPLEPPSSGPVSPPQPSPPPTLTPLTKDTTNITTQEEPAAIQDLEMSTVVKDVEEQPLPPTSASSSTRSLLLRRLLEEKRRSSFNQAVVAVKNDAVLMENDLRKRIQERRKVSGS